MARECAVDLLEGVPLARLMTLRHVPILPAARAVQQALPRVADGPARWGVLLDGGVLLGAAAREPLAELAGNPTTKNQPLAGYVKPTPVIGADRCAREAAEVMGRTGPPFFPSSMRMARWPTS